MKKKKTEKLKLINNFIEFFKNENNKKVIGILFVLFAMYFFIAFTSFLFQWKEDFSIVADKKNEWYLILIDSEVTVNNALGKLDLSEHSSRYVHHSFRHGFSWMLLQKGYNELEAADLLGHKRENIGRTEAGRSYFSRQDISKLVQMVESIPILEIT